MVGLASFACGLLFGFGLLISGMTQPTIVLGFLDIFGRWNPQLAFVMAGALVVSGIGFSFIGKQAQPVWASRHMWPTRTDVDRPLVVGSVLFGIGWGLVGLCPGPALVNLASFLPSVMAFVLAMAAGVIAKDLWDRYVPASFTPPGQQQSSPVDG
jgi:uncharacterized protein